MELQYQGGWGSRSGGVEKKGKILQTRAVHDGKEKMRHGGIFIARLVPMWFSTLWLAKISQHANWDRKGYYYNIIGFISQHI